MKQIAALTAFAIGVTGCASSSKEISTAYVSPVQYQSYDCEQLGAEAQRLTGRLQQLGGRLDEAASNDKALTGVAMILFWPAAFALGGTKGQEAEYARLKGEADAVHQAAVMKKCPGVTAQPVAIPAAAPAQPATSSVSGGSPEKSNCLYGAVPCR